MEKKDFTLVYDRVNNRVKSAEDKLVDIEKEIVIIFILIFNF